VQKEKKSRRGTGLTTAKVMQDARLTY